MINAMVLGINLVRLSNYIPPGEKGYITSIDRRSLCSGRIHYKITLEVCLQDGQVLSLI